MKVLLVHNFYQSSSPSGEDAVYRNEVMMLRSNEVKVIQYEKHNDKIAGAFFKLKAASGMAWSRETYKEVKALIKKEQPDIAHFHNIWYLISPSAYYACQDAGIPIVQTLHNFRFFCINGLFMRNERICEECIGKLPWRGAKYGCYRNSRLYSFPLAITDTLHRLAGTWKNKVDAYIALTEFGKKKFIECGLPAEKIYVKPNFLSDPPGPNYSHNSYGIFLGRISVEKGLNILIDAVNILGLNLNNHVSLEIVGDGPLRESIERTISDRKMNAIEFLGKKNFHECMELLQQSRFLVLPALCYENFPLVIREAYACGKPVIASRLGAMAELVEDGRTGLLFEPGKPQDLADKIQWMFDHETDCIKMGKNSRRVFEEKYTAERNYQILMDIYKQVIGNR